MDKYSAEHGCSFSVNGEIKTKENGADCRYYLSGGRYPGDWDHNENSAWGVCKNGVCTHDTTILQEQGKSCQCQCGSRVFSWDEYCSLTGTMCIKQRGKISELSGNICESSSKTVCSNNKGNLKNPYIAKENCQRQGKFFYNTYSIFSGTTCNCVSFICPSTP